MFYNKAWIGRCKKTIKMFQIFQQWRERDIFFHNKELNIICYYFLQVKTKPYQPLLMYICRIYLGHCVCLFVPPVQYCQYFDLQRRPFTLRESLVYNDSYKIRTFHLIGIKYFNQNILNALHRSMY